MKPATVLLAAMLLALPVGLHAAEASPRRPNVILILAMISATAI
jgi:hypothetical protein